MVFCLVSGGTTPSESDPALPSTVPIGAGTGWLFRTMDFRCLLTTQRSPGVRRADGGNDARHGTPSRLLTRTVSITARRRVALPQRGHTSGSTSYVPRRDSMKPFLVIGIAHLAIGIAALAYQGISYTRREQVAQLGPLRVMTEERKTLPLSPVVGAAAVCLGAILIVVGVRRN
jgi:hypothetical protein